MKLDRNIDGNEGRGKYALLKLRDLEACRETGAFGSLPKPLLDAIDTLQRAGLLEWGKPNTEGEFFVLKLRDQHARHALESYAYEARRFDPEYAAEVKSLADRSGARSPFCKRPD